MNKRTVRAALALTAILAAMPPMVTRAGTVSIAETGDTAPDGNGTYATFFYPSLNDSSQVGFSALLTGTSGGTVDDRGLFRGSGGAVTQIARKGEAVPDGNGVYSGFARCVLNDSGQVGFSYQLTGTSGGTADDVGTFRGSGGVVTQIVREGEAAPDGNGTFLAAGIDCLNAAGQATFRSYLTGTSGGGTDNEGIFRGSGDNLTRIARTGQPAPDGNGTIDDLSGFHLNDSGQVAFEADFDGTSGGSTDDEGIYRGSGGAATRIVRSGQAAPDGNGTFGFLSPLPALNDSGQVSFAALLGGTSGGSTDNWGVFRGSGGAITRIAREGQTAPDGNGVYHDFSPDIICSYPLNSSGQVAFWCNLTGTSGGTTDNVGIFRGSGGAVTQIVRKGDTAPDGNGTYATFEYYFPVLNNAGHVAFVADLAGTSGGYDDDRGIFIGDGVEILQVARAGQPFAGSTINWVLFSIDASSESNGLNDAAQMAYTAVLADGNQQVVLWTPELHWRAAESGAWDTSSNWTLGIAPAALYDVFIDPTAGLTVAGPTSIAGVKSLHVSAASGTTILNLAGALAVQGDATVAGGGRIDLSSGTLNVQDGTLSVGSGGTGAFNLTGGTAIADEVALGGGGTFGFSGANAILRVNTLTGLGSSTAFAGPLQMGHTGGTGSGSHTVGTGRSLTVGGDLILGYDAACTFGINGGGTVTSDNGNIGWLAAANGTVSISGAGSTWDAGTKLRVGFHGDASLTISSGAAVTSDWGYVGLYNGSDGNLTVAGTGSSLSVSQGLLLGSNGTATVDLDSGGLISADYVTLTNGMLTSSAGSTLRVNGLSGFGSAPSFEGSLHIGHAAGSGSGSYSISSGRSLDVEESLVVGLDAAGTLTQSGGTCTVGDYLFVGGYSGSNGAYELSATGSLSADKAIVGYIGAGTFTQSGGTAGVTNDMWIGHSGTGDGTYAISSGTLDVDGILRVGSSGTGELIVTGAVGVIDLGGYIQDDGSTLTSKLDAGGLAVISVTGSAQLDGTWNVIDLGGAPQGRVNVLSASGGISGSFDTVNLPGTDWSWGIDSGTTLWVEHGAITYSAWAAMHGVGAEDEDEDHDGTPNGDEFNLDFDPNDPEQRFALVVSSVSHALGEVGLELAYAKPNGTFRIYAGDTPTNDPGEATPVITFVPMVEAANIAFVDLLGHPVPPHRFYFATFTK